MQRRMMTAAAALVMVGLAGPVMACQVYANGAIQCGSQADGTLYWMGGNPDADPKYAWVIDMTMGKVKVMNDNAADICVTFRVDDADTAQRFAGDWFAFGIEGSTDIHDWGAAERRNKDPDGSRMHAWFQAPATTGEVCAQVDHDAFLEKYAAGNRSSVSEEIILWPSVNHILEGHRFKMKPANGCPTQTHSGHRYATECKRHGFGINRDS